jgi:flagellar protein FliJ
MKRFRFPLRPVAVLRAHREMRAREAFAASVHAYVQSEEVLARTRARVAELAGVLFDGRSGTYLAAEAASLFRAYRAECAEELQAERRVIEARDAMNHRREDYLQANRQLKVVQRLEEKARSRHRVESHRAEQAELDDFAGARTARRVLLT